MGVWRLSCVRLQYGSMASVMCETPVWEYGVCQVVRLQYGSMASVMCETPVWEYGVCQV